MPRVLSPGAAPIYLKDLRHAFYGIRAENFYLEKFQREICEYFGVRYCFLVSSGRAALTLILQALLDISPDRDEVIIPAYTCYSVPASVVRAGCQVVLCDICPDTLDFDYDLLSERISSHTLAIVPCSLFGRPSDFDRLRQCIGARGISIIDDAAQAMGSVFRGKFVGTCGNVGLFSLGRGKNISTVEGGIIVTDNDELAHMLRVRTSSLPCYKLHVQLLLLIQAILLFVFLSPTRYWILTHMPFLGLGRTVYSTNFFIRRMCGVQAGLANGWRYKLVSLNRIRVKNAKYYEQEIFSLGQKRQGQLSEITSGATFHRYPYLLPHKSRYKEVIIEDSVLRKLGVSPMYPDSIDQIPELRLPSFLRTNKTANDIAKRLITFPTHLYVSRNDIDMLMRRLTALYT